MPCFAARPPCCGTVSRLCHWFEGIAAVSGRIQSGRLLIDPDTCPNLAAEGSLYAYDPDEGLVTETPIDRDNHALSALRYLVMGLAKRGAKPVAGVSDPGYKAAHGSANRPATFGGGHST